MLFVTTRSNGAVVEVNLVENMIQDVKFRAFQ